MSRPVATIHIDVCVRPKLSAWVAHLDFGPAGSDGAGVDLSGGYAGTTDNRIVLYGVIHALERLAEPSRVSVVSGSGYAARVLAKGFLDAWAARPDRDKRSLFPDADLWARLRGLLAVHEVTHVRPGPDDEVGRRMHEQAQVVAAGAGFPRDEGAYAFIAY
jgi:ribonuclease HI